MCFTWDSVCQWVLCTGPTVSLIAKFSLECVCQWVPTSAFCVLFYFWCCVCAFTFTFSIFFLKKFIYWEVCFTWDFVCQWVLCTGPTTSLIAKFSLECVCQWVPNVCVLRPFLFLVLRLCVYVFLFFFLIYLLRSVFYVRFCLSVGLMHGTYYLFDSKIFTRMCLSVGPNVYVLRPFFFFLRSVFQQVKCFSSRSHVLFTGLTNLFFQRNFC